MLIAYFLCLSLTKLLRSQQNTSFSEHPPPSQQPYMPQPPPPHPELPVAPPIAPGWRAELEFAPAPASQWETEGVQAGSLRKTLAFFARPLPFCSRLMPLVVVLQREGERHCLSLYVRCHSDQD